MYLEDNFVLKFIVNEIKMDLLGESKFYEKWGEGVELWDERGFAEI